MNVQLAMQAMQAKKTGGTATVVLALGLALSGAAQAQTQTQTQPAPLRLDVPYVPTPDDVVARMLEMGEVGADDFVIDLGSGDGRIAIAAVKDKGAKGAMGVDLNPERISEAQENAKKAGVTDKVTFRQQNLFETDLGKADVITMYLLETVNAKLRPTLLQLKPGTRIVSHAFSLGDWRPDEQANVNGRTVYLWVVPAKVEGRWTLTDGSQNMTLDLKQSFQAVSGDATVNGRRTAISSGKVVGEEVILTVQLDGRERTYRGKVDGARIAPAGTDTWRAERG